jgi:hypothetical protein
LHKPTNITTKNSEASKKRTLSQSWRKTIAETRHFLDSSQNLSEIKPDLLEQHLSQTVQKRLELGENIFDKNIIDFELAHCSRMDQFYGSIFYHSVNNQVIVEHLNCLRVLKFKEVDLWRSNKYSLDNQETAFRLVPLKSGKFLGFKRFGNSNLRLILFSSDLRTTELSKSFFDFYFYDLTCADVLSLNSQKTLFSIPALSQLKLHVIDESLN